MVDLSDKDSKEYIMNMFKELKTSHAIDLKESLMILIHQIEKTNRELEIVFFHKDQMEILEFESTITKIFKTH